MDILATIAERKITEAMARGELDNLAGSGQPLANAGFVPPEVELRKEIVSLREILGQMEDDEQRRNLRRQPDFKLFKLNMTRKRPLDREEFPENRDRIIDRLGG